MNDVPSLFRSYADLLRRYIRHPEEELLHEAYELGRVAMARGLGVLDLGRIYQRALASSFSRSPELKKMRTLKIAEAFFLESLSPFEAAHRGFCEANVRLRSLNKMLERRNTDLDALNRDLHHLSRQILNLQEEERKRISRELHDEIGQLLSAININLITLRRGGRTDSPVLNERIADIQALLDRTINAVHGFACELRPAVLDDLGLLPALRSYVKAFSERTGVRAYFHGSPEAELLDSEQKTVLFRVAQESLNNVAKHAHASRVYVTLSALKQKARMRIKDNGRAFDVEQQLSAGGGKRLGLLGMQERVGLVNGRLDVTSAPGRGTTVCVEIPVKNRMALSATGS